MILIGSGDREKPLRDWTNAYANTNYFFMFKDNPTDATYLAGETATCGSAVLCLNSLLPILTSANSDRCRPRDQERLVPRSARARAGRDLGHHDFWYGDVQHARAGACQRRVRLEPGYRARLQYFVQECVVAERHDDRSQVVTGGGLPPSPVAGMVTLDDGTTVPFCIGCDDDSSLQSDLPEGPSVGAQPKAVTYWYIHK